MPAYFKLAGTMLLGAWLMAGCRTGPSVRVTPDSADESASNPDAEKESSKIPILTPEEMDRRAESHAYYASAIIHDWNEDWEEAKEDYFKAAQIDPSNEPLVLEASQRLLQLKEAGKALEILSNATARATASGALLAQLGRIQFMTGKKELAIQSNRAAMKKSPRLLAPYRNLAQIYLQDRQYEEGLKVLDVAARQTEVEPIYLIELGELYMAFLGSPSASTAKTRALETLKRAAGRELKNPFHQQMLADALAMLGDTDRAAELYEDLLEQHRPLPGLREKLAGIYIRKQDHKKAAEQLEFILRQNPTHAQANYLMGSLALEQKKFPEAVDYFNKTMLLKPDFEPVYYDLAAAQLSQKEPRKSLQTLEKVRQRFKQSFAAEYYSALAYSQLKDYTNVINHLTVAEVIARGSDETNRLNHFYYFQLGAAYERIQKFSEAEKYLKRCLAGAPDFSEALNYLGYMWAERATNLTQAREMIEKALKQEPTNAAYLDSLAWVFFKMGKNQEALKYLLDAIKNSTEPDATIYDHLGDVYQSLKQQDKAREAWTKAFSLEPNEDIQKKLGAANPSKVSVPPH